MSDPELRSPAEWAEELRECAERAEKATETVRHLWRADCRELADRMDDLAEALRLLRLHQERGALGIGLLEDRDALLAKYAEKEEPK